MRDAALGTMTIDITNEQAEVLRDILNHQLKELEIQSAHTDSREYREGLYHREQVVEGLLDKLNVL